MPHLPDLSDPRYLDEVGWFLYHEKYRRDRFGGSYDAERLAYSRLLRDEVAAYLGRPTHWFEDRTVVSIGPGCTGDLATFPALGAENLPLLDRFADIVICRNALDHMPDPRVGLNEMWRILADDGALFVSVDIGGEPTPDEPTVFSVESLQKLLRERFEVVK